MIASAAASVFDRRKSRNAVVAIVTYWRLGTGGSAKSRGRFGAGLPLRYAIVARWRMALTFSWSAHQAACSSIGFVMNDGLERRQASSPAVTAFEIRRSSAE